MTNKYKQNDYVIVGSGILGALIAYHLSKTNKKIIVIDRDELGRATKHAAGIICPWVAQRRNQDWYTLARLGARIFPELVFELESEYKVVTSYQKVGALSLHIEEDRLKKMIERTEKRKEDAPEIGELIYLNENEIQKQYPLINKGYEGVFVSGAARVNGEHLRTSLVKASEKNGVQFIKDDVELITENEKIIGLSSKRSNQKYFAEQIILACGAWEQEILQKANLQTEAHAQKAQLIHLQLDDSKLNDFKNWPVIKPPNNQYLLMNEDNTITAGTTFQRTWNYDQLQPTAKGVQEILTKAIEVIPMLENATIEHISVGLRPVIPDSIPYFGRLTDVGNEHVIIANGLGASGLNTSPFISKAIADLALEKENKNIDISRYKPDISMINE